MRKLLLLSLLCVPASLAAQTMNLPASGGTFHFEQDREPVASLDGQWRFHPGDDALWSSSSFDDSSWTLIETGKSWDKQGYPADSAGRKRSFAAGAVCSHQLSGVRERQAVRRRGSIASAEAAGWSV
jgi:hypothetical protein